MLADSGAALKSPAMNIPEHPGLVYQSRPSDGRPNDASAQRAGEMQTDGRGG